MPDLKQWAIPSPTAIKVCIINFKDFDISKLASILSEVNTLNYICDRMLQYALTAIYLLKGGVSWDFRPPFFHDSTHLGPWYKGWSTFEFGLDFAEIFDHKVRIIWPRGVKILGTANQIFFLQIFSFTPKRTSPDCSSKSNQRLT